jgi:hypothetical protein
MVTDTVGNGYQLKNASGFVSDGDYLPKPERNHSMSQIVTKQVCKCEKCGNEAEMSIVCSLSDEQTGKAKAASKSEPLKIKGTATCSHCGNEADMWIDYEKP